MAGPAAFLRLVVVPLVGEERPQGRQEERAELALGPVHGGQSLMLQQKGKEPLR